MSKYTPIKLTQLSANESAAVDAINQNLDSIKEHIDDSLSRSAKSPSQMQADLDMNGQKLLNLGAPTKDTDVVRLKDVIENKEEIKTLVNTASVAVEKAMEAAETAESAAEDMADQIQKAKDWATKTDGPVEDGEYSSKYYAENIGADVHTVADIATEVTAVAGNATNINSVASDVTNINAVAGDLSNIDAVVSNETNVNAVATNMSDVNDCATNMAAIQDAPNQAANAAASAEAAAQSAAISNPPPLLTHVWSDHLLNDIRYLRADTFSWQSGSVYKAAYDHLVDDYASSTPETDIIDGIEIWYMLSQDGHKIVLAHEQDQTHRTQAVEALYAAAGVAWYYILDTANQRFKLPRTKYGFTGLRDTVGKYVPESLPNITGTFNGGIVGASGAFTDVANVGNGWANIQPQSTVKSFDASRSSSAYQNNAPVQQRATQMYLYFYVGNFTQTATEQTAGLNAELFNGKVDLNAANLSTQGKSLISGLGMPSSSYENLTLGADGSTYIPTANGYYSLTCQINNAGAFVQFSVDNLYSCMIARDAGNTVTIWIPVQKGETCTFNTNANMSNVHFRFIYAKGEENV